MSDDRCPQCNTAATYQLGENSFACKCTYEFETAEQNYNESVSPLTEGEQK